jgi:hypothetical protein
MTFEQLAADVVGLLAHSADPRIRRLERRPAPRHPGAGARPDRGHRFLLVPNAAEAAELLPHGQLAVLPRATHMDMTRSGLVPAVVEAFLAR